MFKKESGMKSNIIVLSVCKIIRKLLYGKVSIVIESLKVSIVIGLLITKDTNDIVNCPLENIYGPVLGLHIGQINEAQNVIYSIQSQLIVFFVCKSHDYRPSIGWKFCTTDARV